MVILFRETWAFYHGGGGVSGHANKVSAGGGASAPSDEHGKNTPKFKAFVERAHSADFAKAALVAIDNAPELVQKLFEKFAEKLEYGGHPENFDPKHKGEDLVAFQVGKQVYFDENTVQNGDVIHTPMENFFHENAHLIDALARADHGWAHKSDISGKIEAAVARDTLRLLAPYVKEVMADHPRLTNVDRIYKLASYKLVDALVKKYPNERDRANISDMLENGFHLNTTSYISTNYPLGAGHGKASDGKSYWVHQGGNKEPLAEVVASLASNPGSLTAIKTEFPDTYSEVISEVTAML